LYTPKGTVYFNSPYIIDNDVSYKPVMSNGKYQTILTLLKVYRAGLNQKDLSHLYNVEFFDFDDNVLNLDLYYDWENEWLVYSYINNSDKIRTIEGDIIRVKFSIKPEYLTRTSEVIY